MSKLSEPYLFGCLTVPTGGNVTTWTGTAVFSSGVGVFGAIVGESTVTFTLPATTLPACGNVTLDTPDFCWSSGSCPGAFSLKGNVTY